MPLAWQEQLLEPSQERLTACAAPPRPQAGASVPRGRAELQAATSGPSPSQVPEEGRLPGPPSNLCQPRPYGREEQEQGQGQGQHSSCEGPVPAPGAATATAAPGKRRSAGACRAQLLCKRPFVWKPNTENVSLEFFTPPLLCTSVWIHLSKEAII